jgi:hypothetical protein
MYLSVQREEGHRPEKHCSGNSSFESDMSEIQ